uniref:Uncharacterized protein n=1 Tax=Rhizophora mucronata TaxID=61149 RepID=A0A2P2K5C4_RHIMU
MNQCNQLSYFFFFFSFSTIEVEKGRFNYQ